MVREPVRCVAPRYALNVQRHVAADNKCINMNLMARDSLRIDSRGRHALSAGITVLDVILIVTRVLSYCYRLSAINVNGCQSYKTPYFLTNYDALPSRRSLYHWAKIKVHAPTFVFRRKFMRSDQEILS